MRSSAERGGALLGAAYLALALHGLGAADIVGDDEAREAGVVQDIVAGHVLLPTFNGDLLPDKPILYHWLAALPCAVAGFSETAVRLPAALAGAGLVTWTAVAGANLLGPRAGIAAAAMLATTPALFNHARVARPDTLLVLLLSAALGCAFRWYREGRRRDATTALVLLGVATFAKGPVAFVLFGLTLGGFLFWQRELGRLRGFFTLPGVTAFLVLGFGWYAVALAGWGDLFVREHLVGRYLRNLAGGLVTGQAYSPKPLRYHVLFYVEHLPAVALPWTPVVALALWHLRRGRGLANARVRFLLCWALAPVIAFTPAEYKLRYYLLPSLPALALLGAPAALALLETRSARRPDTTRVAIALALGLAAVVVAGLVLARPELLSHSDRSTLTALLSLAPGGTAGVAVLVGVAVGVVGGAVALGAWGVLLASAAAGSVVWQLFGTPALEQATSRRDSLRPFANAVAARYPPPAPVVFYGAEIRQVAVYLARRVPQADRIAAGTGVITVDRDYRRLVAIAAVGPPLALGEGRIGNIERARVVLAEGTGAAVSELAGEARGRPAD